MATKRSPNFRVRFVYDDDRHFEECNGEDRPLTEEEYHGNEYRACPLHLRAGTKQLATGVQGCAICGNTEYADIPYEEYLEYYGNPDRHVYLGCVVDKQCHCCNQWEKTVSSVWSVDFMDDSPEYDAINVDEALTPEQAVTLPGYAGEIAREQLADAGYKLPRRQKQPA